MFHPGMTEPFLLLPVFSRTTGTSVLTPSQGLDFLLDHPEPVLAKRLHHPVAARARYRRPHISTAARICQSSWLGCPGMPLHYRHPPIQALPGLPRLYPGPGVRRSYNTPPLTGTPELGTTVLVPPLVQLQLYLASTCTFPVFLISCTAPSLTPGKKVCEIHRTPTSG